MTVLRSIGETGTYSASWCWFVLWFSLCICSIPEHVLPFVIYAKVKAQYCLLTGLSVLHYFTHVHQTRECVCKQWAWVCWLKRSFSYLFHVCTLRPVLLMYVYFACYPCAGCMCYVWLCHLSHPTRNPHHGARSPKRLTGIYRVLRSLANLTT